jgi:2-polyprenyl-6-methoxyphenol hydroxylase-like FAD-dependent oxidoreductase
MGSDAWTDRTVVSGAVLVGDAAGWNDPILGCGLSIALRDARSVAEVLTSGDRWTPEAFEPYVAERAERMRRLRMCAHLSTQLHCTFTLDGRARRAAFRARMMSDPLVRGLRTISLVGPEHAPAASFTDDVMAQALAPA